MDVANGPGVRVAIFVSGCSGMPCREYCFNKDIQSFKVGDPWTETQTKRVLSAMDHEWISGVTLLGGEPFLNFRGLIPVVDSIREKFGSSKSVWAFSGFTFEQILPIRSRVDLLRKCDVLIDGPFVPALKDDRLRFRGSANQRILDVPASLASNNPTWAYGFSEEESLGKAIVDRYTHRFDVDEPTCSPQAI